MKTVTLSLTVLAALAGVSLAQAPAMAPISNWTYYNHASTAGEGYLRGQAAAVQAVGQANYLNSLAAVNYADAYRRQIENNNLYVKTYIANREEVYKYRERYTRTPLTKEQWQEFSQNALPDRLTSDQYSNGKLVWPHILRMDAYKPLRERIDVLAAKRSPEDSGDGSPTQREIASLVDTMKIMLRQNINSLSSSQFGDSKWFLTCLDYEMKHTLEHTPAVAGTASQPLPASDASVSQATIN